jgi:integrase
MPKMKLTQVAVDKLRPPETGRIEIWDTVLPAFGLRIAAARTGQEPRKTWQVMYRVNGKQVRETIGTLGTIARLEDARNLARLSIRKAQNGINPLEERQQAEDTERQRIEAEAARQYDVVAAVADRYLDRYAVKRMRHDYFAETKRTFERDLKPALGTKPIGEVTRRDVRELIEAIVERGSPSHANHVLAYARAFLNWAVSNDLIERNPCDGLKMPAPAVERDRALDDREIRLFWLACDQIGWPFGPLFQLLLLTAQRRDELAQAEWTEFDLDRAVWTLPRERTKNDKAHIVHLSSSAVQILAALPRAGEHGFLFTTTGDSPVSGFGRARERLATSIAAIAGAIEPFTLHDLRRTAATGMAGLGVAHHVVDRILNHVAGKISGVARIYNRHEYADERRAALERWARHVEELIRPMLSNVVRLAAG